MGIMDREYMRSPKDKNSATATEKKRCLKRDKEGLSDESVTLCPLALVETSLKN